MTTHNQARDIILAQFNTDWAGATTVAYDSEEFTPPANEDAWVRLSIQPKEGDQISLGATGDRQFRYWGFVFIQVFTRVGKPIFDNDTLAQSALDIFEGKHLQGIWFREGRIEQVGVDGKWFQQNVILQYIFDRIK